MTAENTWPKVSGDILYASEANYETGTTMSVEAGEAITAGNVVYVHLTDGKAYVSGTGTAADIRADGIAKTTAALAADVVIQTRGVYVTAALTDKEDYYLGAAGALSTTRSGVRVGTALSTGLLYINIVQDNHDTVGTVKPYLKSFTGIPTNNFTAFWVECNGQVLADTESPLDGQTIPDLNGSAATKRFLRGSTTSGTTGGSETHTHGLTLVSRLRGSDPPDTTWPPATTDSASTLPSYYEVVFIMKVK